MGSKNKSTVSAENILQDESWARDRVYALLSLYGESV